MKNSKTVGMPIGHPQSVEKVHFNNKTSTGG
jgi:hypothetical protein